MIDFTKDELYEIEKAFDDKAAQMVSALALIIGKLHHSKSSGELITKLIGESIETFDAFRSISVKCQQARK